MDQAELDQLISQRVEVTTPVDDRTSFYLDNRELIETWANLRTDASKTLTNAVHDLAAPLADDLRTLGVEPAVNVTDGRWPAVQLARTTWEQQGHTSPVVVGLEWDRQPLNSAGALRVYATVIAPRSHPRASEIEPALQALSDRLRSALDSRWKRNVPRWPAWKLIEAPEDPWTVEEIANRARAAALQLWAVAAPEIDRVLDPITDLAT